MKFAEFTLTESEKEHLARAATLERFKHLGSVLAKLFGIKQPLPARITTCLTEMVRHETHDAVLLRNLPVHKDDRDKPYIYDSRINASSCPSSHVCHAVADAAGLKRSSFVDALVDQGQVNSPLHHDGILPGTHGVNNSHTMESLNYVMLFCVRGYEHVISRVMTMRDLLETLGDEGVQTLIQEGDGYNRDTNHRKLALLKRGSNGRLYLVDNMSTANENFLLLQGALDCTEVREFALASGDLLLVPNFNLHGVRTEQNKGRIPERQPRFLMRTCPSNPETGTSLGR